MEVAGPSFGLLPERTKLQLTILTRVLLWTRDPSKLGLRCILLETLRRVVGGRHSHTLHRSSKASILVLLEE